MKFIVAIQKYTNLGHRIVYGDTGYEVRTRVPLRDDGLHPDDNREWRLPLGYYQIGDMEYAYLVARLRQHPDGPIPMSAEEAVLYAQSVSSKYVAIRSPQEGMGVLLAIRNKNHRRYAA